jgi:hypothetical protein
VSLLICIKCDVCGATTEPVQTGGRAVRWVAYDANRKWKRMRVRYGEYQDLCPECVVRHTLKKGKLP